MKNKDAKAEISFKIDDNGRLNVRVDTERLILESVTEDDISLL